MTFPLLDSSNRRCVVHIGAPKTGSTVLQKLFFENRDRLRAAGYTYPNVSLRGFGHHDLAFLIGGGYPEWATPQLQSLSELTALLREESNGAEHLLISSENFYLFPAARALFSLLADSGASRDRKIQIVVYVRRQDAAQESWFNQTIKAQGATHDFEECAARYHTLWDYDARLRDWVEVFGADAIVLRPYEERQFLQGSLILDFLAILGLSPEGFDCPAERVNSSLNRDLLEFQRALNRLPVSVERKRIHHRRLIELSTLSRGSGTFDDSPVIGGDRRRSILSEYAAGNSRLAKTYFGRNELFLDEPKDAPETPPPILTTEKLAAILGWLSLPADLK